MWKTHRPLYRAPHRHHIQRSHGALYKERTLHYLHTALSIINADSADYHYLQSALSLSAPYSKFHPQPLIERNLIKTLRVRLSVPADPLRFARHRAIIKA
jgi:hypothetical protein